MKSNIFKTGNSYEQIIDFFSNKDFKIDSSIDDIDKPDYLQNRKSNYFFINDAGDNLGIIEYFDEENVDIFKKEFDILSIYSLFLIKSDLSEFIFLQYDKGTGKISKLRKKQNKIEIGFVKKLEGLQYNDLEAFDKIFDKSELIREFHESYSLSLNYLIKNIEGISEFEDKEVFGTIIMNRLMFLWFLQKKALLNKDIDYLITKFKEIVEKKSNYYNDFLQVLFFDGLCQEVEKRDKKTTQLLNQVPYLNGGLFLKSEIEEKYENLIKIRNQIFFNEKIEYPISKNEKNIPVLNLLESKEWTIDEKSGDVDKLSPEILGMIFEKYVNKKDLGAVYTPEFVTTYICKNTIYSYILDRLNKKFNKNYEKFDEIFDVSSNEEIQFAYKVLINLKILDPAVGSGHFLIDALYILEQIYSRFKEKGIVKWSKGKIRKHIIINSL